jgi:hypothetical protein
MSRGSYPVATHLAMVYGERSAPTPGVGPTNRLAYGLYGLLPPRHESPGKNPSLGSAP